MRKNYSLDKQQSLAWGFDKASGFFIQVLEETDEYEKEWVSADQGNALGGFSFSLQTLTYEDMIRYLTTYSERALTDFLSFMKQPVSAYGAFGYAFVNKQQQYRQKTHIATYEDLFRFIDSVQPSFGYILTDMADRYLDLYILYQEMDKVAGGR